MAKRVGRIVSAGLIVVSTQACGLIGPSCLAQQQRGTVTTLSGEVGAAARVVHRVVYETQGSQNEVRINWPGQFASGGPRVRIYATKTGCADFILGARAAPGACPTIGGFAGAVAPDARPCALNYTCNAEIGDLVQTSLIITNGRGNPDILGLPAEYLLWVVGDPAQATTYTMTITWFYGPDC